MLQYQWEGHIARITDRGRGPKLLEWRLHIVKRSVGQAHWAGKTTSSESLGAAGNKRDTTVELGNTYKRSMRSKCQCLEVMIMKIVEF
ncbi:jg15889 [Pararge aegeria aegeria]|uniref:Jg15889 protein n=1 Tax=Pararge aegeria aegeria TaxID=348720 RepID=A0A8S4SNB2_9NEOP|nr:jg15889 [Pararge aegeria aegeria]